MLRHPFCSDLYGITHRRRRRSIFSRFALPKVLKRIGLQANECTLTEEGLDAVVEDSFNTSGIRDLEQVVGASGSQCPVSDRSGRVKEVVFDAEKVEIISISNRSR